MKNIIRYRLEIFGIIICLGLGMLSGYLVKGGDSAWYINLNKPSFNPPNFVFAPIWTLIYIMIGIALGKLWKNKSQNKSLLFIFAVQFILNLLWSPIFFHFHKIGLALIDAILLWFSIILLIIFAYKKHRIVFFLFIPYILWVSFAVLLNLSLYLLNT